MAAARGDAKRLRILLDSGRVHVDCKDKVLGSADPFVFSCRPAQALPGTYTPPQVSVDLAAVNYLGGADLSSGQSTHYANDVTLKERAVRATLFLVSRKWFIRSRAICSSFHFGNADGPRACVFEGIWNPIKTFPPFRSASLFFKHSSRHSFYFRKISPAPHDNSWTMTRINEIVKDPVR